MAETPKDVRRFTRPAFGELARSLHASYLDRWSRHDLAELERHVPQGAPPPKEEPESHTSAA